MNKPTIEQLNIINDTVSTTTNIYSAQKVDTLISASSNNYISVSQASHSFLAGDFVRVSSTANTYVKSIADNSVNSEVSGVVVEVVDANNFILAFDGKILGSQTGFSGLTAGSLYWLSSTVAGTHTITAPTNIGEVQRQVFKAINTTDIELVIGDNGVVIGQEKGVYITGTNYNATNTLSDYKIIATTAGITITLPDITGLDLVEKRISNRSSGTITVSGYDGSQIIVPNNSQTINFTSNGGGIFESSNGEWDLY